jgi:hypothetical protein
MQSEVGVGEISRFFSKRFIHYLGLRRLFYQRSLSLTRDIRMDT